MPKSKPDVSKALRDAASGDSIVRIRRAKLERGYVDGYVLAVSPKLALLLPVTDRMDFDGFHVVRTKDITAVVEAPFSSFQQRALALKKVARPTTPAIDLTTTGAMLTSAQALFPLLAIYRERISSGGCEIGRVVAVEAKTYRLREIDPGAAWRDDESSYRRAEVTRVDFDGGYERALALVASEGLRAS